MSSNSKKDVKKTKVLAPKAHPKANRDFSDIQELYTLKSLLGSKFVNQLELDSLLAKRSGDKERIGQQRLRSREVVGALLGYMTDGREFVRASHTGKERANGGQSKDLMVTYLENGTEITLPVEIKNVEGLGSGTIRNWGTRSFAKYLCPVTLRQEARKLGIPIPAGKNTAPEISKVVLTEMYRKVVANLARDYPGTFKIGISRRELKALVTDGSDYQSSAACSATPYVKIIQEAFYRFFKALSPVEEDKALEELMNVVLDVTIKKLWVISNDAGPRVSTAHPGMLSKKSGELYSLKKTNVGGKQSEKGMNIVATTPGSSEDEVSKERVAMRIQIACTNKQGISAFAARFFAK